MKKDRQPSLTALALMLIVAVLLVMRLTEAPPLWFDEGWVLSVARNWAVAGHYGLMRNGEPIIGNMPSVGIPAIAPIALSFHAFGIGVWQGRLPGILFTLAALWFLYLVSSDIRGSRAGFWALFAAAFMSTLASVSPLIMGKQALGEMPGLCFLLGGYLVLWRARDRPWLLVAVSCLWGLTIATQLLFVPFLALGILTPALLLAIRKCRREAFMFLAALCGALAVSLCVALLETWLQRREVGFGESSLPFVATALVPVMHVRISAFRTLALAAMPTIVGLLTAIPEVRRRLSASADCWHDYISLSLMACIVSWVTWYLLMSYGWPRYLFPPLFIGNIFVGALMAGVTSAPDTKRHEPAAVSEAICGRRVTMGRIIVRVILAGAIPLSFLNLYSLHASTPRSSIPDVVEYLNSSTPADSLIETCEMELLFMVNRRYHYPSNDVQIRLNQRKFEAKRVELHYDPLRSDPDYLIVGPHGAMWRLYDPAIEAGRFRFLRDFRPYRLYVRER